jgi:hypothetical protein
MTHSFDEFSKSLADESVPRRESLRRLGLVITGALLGPLALGPGAAKAGPFGHAGHRGFSKRSAGAPGKRQPDPCQSFCKCQNSRQQKQCLAACRSCNGETNRLAGGCGSYTCVSLSSDPHCGAINNNCSAHGLTCCGGTCVDATSDASNCGGCGVVCSGSTPFCVAGRCTAGDSECSPGLTKCGATCVNLSTDAANCGACGVVCPSGTTCVNGTCTGSTGECGPGLTWCGFGCVDLSSDPYNCGACSNQCAPSEACSGGVCQGICVGC